MFLKYTKTYRIQISIERNQWQRQQQRKQKPINFALNVLNSKREPDSIRVDLKSVLKFNSTIDTGCFFLVLSIGL